MNIIGVAMIVGGMAFLFSGLIFLIPTERKISPSDVEEVERYLREVRRERWHPVESLTPDER
jgi:hypothetical protein